MAIPNHLKKLSVGEVVKLFVRTVARRLEELSKVDVVIVGAGPAGLACAWKLAEKGLRVLVLERMLGVGGGIRGGGMLLPLALVEEGMGLDMVKELRVRMEEVAPGLYAVDPTELVVALAHRAIQLGAKIWPGIFVEDLVVDYIDGKPRIGGVVINLSPIIEAGWHVDPLYIESRAVVDATGHDAYVAKLAIKKLRLGIEVKGLGPLAIWRGEEEVVASSGKLVDGLYVAGIAVGEIFGTHRMGPIVGGMLESGRRVAEQICRDLGA